MSQLARLLPKQVTSLSGQAESNVQVEARLLSVDEEKQVAVRPTLAFPTAAGGEVCRAHHPDAAAADSRLLVMPLEQATTDSDGQFKLLGLLPGGAPHFTFLTVVLYPS